MKRPARGDRSQVCDPTPRAVANRAKRDVCTERFEENKNLAFYAVNRWFPLLPSSDKGDAESIFVTYSHVIPSQIFPDLRDRSRRVYLSEHPRSSPSFVKVVKVNKASCLFLNVRSASGSSEYYFVRFLPSTPGKWTGRRVWDPHASGSNGYYMNLEAVAVCYYNFMSKLGLI